MVSENEHSSVLASFLKGAQKAPTYADLRKTGKNEHRFSRMARIEGGSDIKLEQLTSFDFNGTTIKVAKGHYHPREVQIIYTPGEESHALIEELRQRLLDQNIIFSGNFDNPYDVYFS